MHREQQDVFVLGHLQQVPPHQRPGCQIERDLCLLLGHFVSLQHPLRPGEHRQVGLRQPQCERRGDDLHRHAVNHGKTGAQHVMAA